MLGKIKITEKALLKQPVGFCEYCGKQLEIMEMKLPWKKMSIISTCECLLKKRKQQEKENQKLEIMNILKKRGFQFGKYANMTFKGFCKDNLKTDVLSAVTDYMDSVNFKDRNWLYLYGDCGLGKTYIAVATARQIAISRLWSPALFRWTEYCSLIQQSWQNKKIEIPWNLGRKAQILVLDDIDKKVATPWALGELYDILNFRDISGLPTIITANRSITELSDFWSRNKEAGEISKAIVSRILGQVAKMIQFKGKDYRLHG